MLSKRKYEYWIRVYPFLIITTIIFIFNISSIWNFDGLFQDDQFYYFRVYDKSISDLEFKRNIIQAIYTLGIVQIATQHSVFFARFLIVLLIILPSSFLIYYFSHLQYHLKKHTSIAIAVIPFILPNQMEVPTFFTGSYLVLAILFAMISMYFILRFSKQAKFNLSALILALLFYFLATETSELFASMLPVFLFIVFIIRKLTWKQILIGTALSFIALRKIILVIIKPHGSINSISNDLSGAVIKHRIVHFLDFINPIYGLTKIGYLNIIIICIIILGAIIVIGNHKRIINILHSNHLQDEKKSKYFFIVYYYLFPFLCLAFSAIPFLFYSQYFTSRYFAFPAIATGFLMIISIEVIIGLFTNRAMASILILVLIIGFSGYNRQINFNKFYKNYISQFKSLKQTLEALDLPYGAQVIVTAPDNKLLIGNGKRYRSNGSIHYILNRRDLKGQIMVEKNNYDPFKISEFPVIYPQSDIDTAVNTCLVRCFNKDSSLNRRLYYALRWVDDSNKSSPWSIFHFDQQGKPRNYISGNGYEYYESVVDSLSAYGIRREDIMFGGIPNRQDSLRLGL